MVSCFIKVAPRWYVERFSWRHFYYCGTLKKAFRIKTPSEINTSTTSGHPLWFLFNEPLEFHWIRWWKLKFKLRAAQHCSASPFCHIKICLHSTWQCVPLEGLQNWGLIQLTVIPHIFNKVQGQIKEVCQLIESCTVPKKWRTVLVNWGLKERWFWMALRILNQILGALKLGKPPKAHLVPIWPDLVRICWKI